MIIMLEAKAAATSKKQLSCFDLEMPVMMRKTAPLSHLMKNDAPQG
jgi:hypothetical protein